MKKVLSRFVPVMACHVRSWIQLEYSLLLVKLRIKLMYYRPVIQILSVEAVILAIFASGFIFWQGLTLPEVYMSYDGVATKVVDRDGQEYSPTSVEGKKIIQGSYEPVWVN